MSGGSAAPAGAPYPASSEQRGPQPRRRPSSGSAGVVTEFDEHRGTGTVRSVDGRELFFHCTGLTGGSRTIDVGTKVSFSVVPGHRGRWEAADVEELGS